MQPAPAVTVVCADGGAWRLLRITLPGMAAGMGTLWATTWMEPDGAWRFGVALAAAVGVAVLAWRRTAADGAPRLTWDGAQWRLSAADAEPAIAGIPADVHVAIDTGGWMLLRVRPHVRTALLRPTLWAALGRADGAVRAALYAPSRPSAPAGASRTR